MALKTFTVEVTQTVEVVLDDQHLNDDFNKQFGEYMWDVSGLEDHAKHLAQMEARGLIGFDRQVEGYGDLRDMNGSVKITDKTEEIV